MSRLLSLFLLVLMPLGAQAERVRVVVAVEDRADRGMPRGPEALAAGVAASIESASGFVPWGRGPAFSVEIDRADLALLELDPRVRAISIDEGGSGALKESLPLIGMPAVRAQGFDGAGVTVAVLDTGIDRSNADFSGRIVAEECFCAPGCCPNGASRQSGPGSAIDDHGHGTHVTGIAAGNGTLSPAGLAPAASVVALKVMDSNNRFSNFTQIYQALDWLLQNRPDVHVINMSLGSAARYTVSGCQASAVAIGLQPIIAQLRARGVLITASTGNEADLQKTTLPACMTDVIGVGAVYDTPGTYLFPSVCTATAAVTDQVTCFTNSNDGIDLLAPGASVVSSRVGGGTISYSGTSMAAPHVAGVLALMRQAGGGLLTAAEAEQILKTSGRMVTDARTGLTFPRLDAAAAIAATPRPQPLGPRRRSVRN